MDFIPGTKNDIGRRTAEDRREEEREDDRRNSIDRRGGDTLARTLVHVFDTVRLPAVADFVKFLKALKLLGPLAMIISAMLMAVTYTLTMKVSLAFGIVAILIVHEFGHYTATWLCGYTPRWWLHIPFLGALMMAPDFRSRHDEAFIAYGGPFVGGVFSLLLFAFWMLVPLSLEWGAVCYLLAILSTILNLFNLIPLSPLDGGRITQAIHPMFRWIGFIMLCVVSYVYREASFAVVWILVIGEVRMNPVFRFRIASLLLVMMALLVAHGYHSEHLWEDGIYFVFGAYLVKMHYDRTRYSEVVEHDSRNRELSRRTRMLWAFNYLGLLAALSLLLYVLIRLAPQATL
jgi:Zn-dependent protease